MLLQNAGVLSSGFVIFCYICVQWFVHVWIIFISPLCNLWLFFSFKISIAVISLLNGHKVCWALKQLYFLRNAWRRFAFEWVLQENMWRGSHVAMHINGSLRARSPVNRRIELTCSQRHNLNLRRSQETLANYLPNAFQDLPADNGKANLFGWSVSYRNRPRKAHSNFTWYDRRFPFTLRLGLPRGSAL